MKKLFNETIQLMLNHKSIRKFDPDFIIPKNDIDLVIRAGQQASTSGSLQMYTVIEISKEKRQDVNTICGTQQFIRDASYFGIIFADFYRLKRMLELLGGVYNNHPALAMTMSPLDAGLMAQNMALAAESLGYGMVFCGACGDFGEIMKIELKVPKEVIPLTGIAIGKSLEDPMIRPRLPTDLIHHLNEYKEYSDRELREGIIFMSEKLSENHRRKINWGESLVKRFNGGWAQKRDKTRRKTLNDQNFVF